jgi:hypothetical protein
VIRKAEPAEIPAMEAGVTDRLWDLPDIVRIVDEWEANQKE